MNTTTRTTVTVAFSLYSEASYRWTTETATFANATLARVWADQMRQAYGPFFVVG